jgi:pimeloyl-ACP methyl ester carboxylesterase/2-polyprenyl-6-methoxyphenol hydroxylase-like FAD-dependent oxidoreductase
MSNPVRSCAVVLGAGMAGLFAGRVLAGAYDEVVLVDRDPLVDERRPRRGVPQGRHVHGLLARGQQVIEDLFPGITDEMVDDGAARGDVTGNVRWVLGGQPMRQPHSGLVALSASRPFLEQHIRARVAALPGVRFLSHHDIVDLVTTDDATRVTGVLVADNAAEGAPQRTLPADLVVDATGRGSRTPVWLERLGYPAVAEETVKISLSYTTRHFRLPPDQLGDNLAVHVVASPWLPRGAVCARVDGGRTVVTAYAVLGDSAPTDQDGFLAFLKSLSTSDVYDAVQDAEPLDDLVIYRFPANLRRRYERLATSPAGLLVVGDAVCSFNPTYAQGMTVAALGAQVLGRHIEHPEGPRPQEFFADLARDAVDDPWDMAIAADLAHPAVIGERSPELLRRQETVGRVLGAGAHHDEVAVAYARVVSLVDPPSALTRPEITALLDTRATNGGATVTAEPVRLTIADLTFDVEVSGPPDGDAVLLLHGFPHNSRSWSDIVPALHRAGLRTIAPDQRGYSPGARPTEVEAYALPLLAQDALDVLDALEVKTAHVVGHDWGAVVAWYLAARHSDRVRTLTAVAFPHLDAYQHAYRVDPEQQRCSGYIDYFSAADTEKVMLADGAAKLRELLAGADNALTPEQQARYVEFHTQPGTLDAALNWYRVGTLLDGRAAMGPVPVPTTFIWSEADESVSTFAAEQTAEYVTGPYRLVTLRDVSHWQPQQVPELVAEEILALIEDRRA